MARNAKKVDNFTPARARLRVHTLTKSRVVVHVQTDSPAQLRAYKLNLPAHDYTRIDVHQCIIFTQKRALLR